jgi:hypothetical protein
LSRIANLEIPRHPAAYIRLGYAPKYLSENADGMFRDWPRIPLGTNLRREADAAHQTLEAGICAQRVKVWFRFEVNK